MYQDPFLEYVRIGEPKLAERAKIWSAAIGLQGVDQLETSDYLKETAALHMEGELTLYDVHERITGYYEKQPQLKGTPAEEADKVSVQIAMLLSEDAFTFSLMEYVNIHKILFSEIYDHAGKIRTYNITKKEWVLREKSVTYGSATHLYETLEYDMKQEKSFSYDGLDMDVIISHLAGFVSKLWQIHAFEEGNTRTTAVFFIKYLRSMGFNVGNEIFAENAWYFRNALVRANYSSLQDKVHETTEYVERFLENLLKKEEHVLSNRTMHLDYDIYMVKQKVNIGSEKVNIGSEKVNIGSEKANIGSEKVNIESEKANIGSEKVNIGSEKVNIGSEKVNIGSEKVNIVNEELSEINKAHMNQILEEMGYDKVFGRMEVRVITGLGTTRASALLKVLVSMNVITQVHGYGKGKYKFVKSN